MGIPTKLIQIECAFDFYLIVNRHLQQSNSTRVRVKEIAVKWILIKYAFYFHLITNNYAVHFTTPRSLLSILYYRASPKLSIGANIVFIGSIGKVMPSRIDYSSVISF